MKSLAEIISDAKQKKQGRFNEYLKSAGIRQDEWQLYKKAKPEEAEAVEKDIETMPPEELAQEIQGAVRSFQSEARNIFEDSELSTMTINRIKNAFPQSEWKEQMERKQGKREAQGKKLPKLELINHEVFNRLLQGDCTDGAEAEDAPEQDIMFSETLKTKSGNIMLDGRAMTFTESVILSAIYNFINYRYTTIEIKDLHAVTHPQTAWRNVQECDRDYFKRQVISTLEAVREWSFSYANETYTGAEFILDAEIKGDTIAIHSNRKGIISKDGRQSTNPILFDLCKQDSRFIPFPDGIFNTHKLKINWLAKIYVARRVALAYNDHNKMSATILYSTLKKNVGAADRTKIKSYYEYLKNAGIIADWTHTHKGICWTPQLKTDGSQTIAIKDKENKNYINDIEKPENIKQIEAELRDYNTFIKNQIIKAGEKPLDGALMAVYNRGSWEMGGRLYTHNGQQDISKAERKNITINGQQTTELDFSNLHINMLYHANNLQFSGDAYDFSADREKAKKALLIAIDSKNEKAAKYKLAALLAGYKDGQRGEIEKVSQYIPEAENLLAKAATRHAPIKDLFFQDAGLELQNTDAEIMRHIIRELQRRKIVALPIHDSVIIAKEKADEAKKVMQAEYKKVMGYNCPIK